MIIGLTGRRDDGTSAGAGKDAVADRLVTEHGFVRIALADPIKRVAAQLYDFSEETLWGPSELRNALDVRYPRQHGPWVKERSMWRCACCRVPADSVRRAVDYENGAPVRLEHMCESSCQCYLTARFALQLLGTELGRTLYKNTWVDLALADAKAVLVGRGYSRRTGVREPWCHERRAVGVVVSDVRWPAGNEGTAIKAASFTHGVLWCVDRPGSSSLGATHESERQAGAERDDLFAAVIKNDGDIAHLGALVDEALARTREAQ